MATNKLRVAVRKYDPFETAIDKIWSKFCKKTGCTLELEAIPLDLHPLYDTLLKEKGLEKGVWDIALINTDWITEAYHSNAIEDLTGYIANNKPDNFPEGWSSKKLG